MQRFTTRRTLMDAMCTSTWATPGQQRWQHLIRMRCVCAKLQHLPCMHRHETIIG
jgi:hypothetical protein